MIERTYQVCGPFALRQTLRFALPGASSAADLGQGTSSYALITAGGAATVTLRVAGDVITTTAVGPGAESALAGMPRMLGLDDDPTEFAAVGGPLRDLHRNYRGLRLGSTGRVFDVLLPTILGQRVTTAEAKKSYRRLCQALGEPAPGELDLTLPPLPEALARMSYEEFHAFGVERSRAQILIEVARRASRLEEMVTMNHPEAMRRLGAVKGIGPWTIAQVMGVAWGDRDAVPLGDFHLPNTVAWLLAGEPRGTDERMEELLEPFRPHRRRAIILIKLSGVKAPRYGPKSPKNVISRG
ncbi:MAG: DNA-3-methyladenine glycosylase 2 family protein [Actinomycetota bacterium]|nr:DNA-3-methyladenine glycosylase 2 family protein [Actinomycetota bacterium]